MRVNIKGLINRLDSLRERINDLFDNLDCLEELEQEDIEIETVQQYLQNDDTFNLSIALDVLEQADKLDQAVEIIKKYPFVVFHIIKGMTYYELQHEMPNTELPIEEEYELLKEVLL